MAKNMELVCRMWKFSAMEYMRFLRRYGIECFGLSITFGENIAVYADEETYLKISVEDNMFNENEKQLTSLLRLIEQIIDEAASMQKEFDDEDITEEHLLDYDD